MTFQANLLLALLWAPAKFLRIGALSIMFLPRISTPEQMQIKFHAARMS
jgi:hypothetical protein